MKRFWINGIYNSAVLLLGIVHIKVLFYFIDKDILNTFFYFQALIMFAGTIPMVAFEITFQNFVPKSEEEGRRKILGNALLISTLIYLLLSAIVSLYRREALPYVPLMYATVILSLMISYSRAMSRFHLANGIYIVSILLTISGLWIFRPGSPIAIASIYFISGAIPAIISLPLFKPIFRMELSRDFIQYLKGSLFAVITSPIMRYWDRILLERVSPQHIAGFTLVRRIDRLLRQILSSFMIWIIPRLSNPRTREKTVKMFFPSYIALSLLLVSGEILAGRWLLRVFARADYAAYYPVLLIFALTLLISSIYSFKMTLLRLSGRIEPFVVHNYLFSIVFVIASLFLLKFSVAGIATAFLIATLSAALYIMTVR